MLDELKETRAERVRQLRDSSSKTLFLCAAERGTCTLQHFCPTHGSRAPSGSFRGFARALWLFENFLSIGLVTSRTGALTLSLGSLNMTFLDTYWLYFYVYAMYSYEYMYCTIEL